MRFLTLLFIGLIAFSPAATAQSPTPPSHPVKEMQDQIKAREEHEKQLKAELKKIKSGLEEKRGELVSVAKDIKKNEQNLITLEQRITAKETEQKEIETRLNDDRGAISDLILAMERMRRIPPEALLAKPGAPLETAQSAMLLESVLPRVHKRAEGLKADMEVLADIITDLKKDREAVMNSSKQLETSQKKLSGLLSQREILYDKTAKDVEKEQAELKRISLQASNLRDLVARIERKQKQEDAEREAALRAVPVERRSARAAPTPMPKTGEAQLPISGTMRIGYGKPDDIGAVSQGIKIEGRPNALVVAPMGGVVDYAGVFKGYGQIIILKHQKGYHSLIAGLGKIDTVVGRAVSAGEPIGKMGAPSDGNAPSLYYELRHEGNPVNPSKKIAGLK